MAGVPTQPLQPMSEEDYKERMLQFEIDCDDGKGNAYACHSVGEFKALVDKNYEAAAEVFKTNCDGKNKYAASCFKLGRLLMTGKGVAVSDPQALVRFEQACDRGHTQGCFFLGSMLAQGINGVKQDLPRAESVFTKACDDSDVGSCYHLGQQYLSVNPYGPRDPPKAQTCLTTACNLGHAPSCRLLAVMFKNGDTGVEPNAELFQHYRQRTEQLVRERGEMQGLRVA